MHDTARKIAKLFFEAYADRPQAILELGSYNVNGSLRDVCPREATYIGLDIEAGPGVDIITKPNSPLPIASNSIDIVVSSSMFEHDMFFWETFLEMSRITRPGGILYINAPSNGSYHCYPVDNWRFYPDSGKALEGWAQRNGYDITLIESFLAERMSDMWNDFVGIFKKGNSANAENTTFLSTSVPSTNVWQFGQSAILAKREFSEDIVLIRSLQSEVRQLRGKRCGDPTFI